MSVAAGSDRASSVASPWNIPPLVRSRAARGELEEGFRLGELAIAHLRRVEDGCEVYLVTHVIDGASYMARVARRATLAKKPELADALLASARLRRGHRHPNLVTVIGCGLTEETAPRPYVLHERLVGRDLASYQARHGSVDGSLRLAIGLQCAAALDALHRIGLSHGDVRRARAMLVPVGGDPFQIKLGGFEHARPIRPGAAAHEEPRVAADLAALGVMLQELAAGAAEDLLSAELARISTRMFAPAPGQRFTSAAEVHAALAATREALDPAHSVAAVVDDVLAPGARRAPEFGQVSLVMARERPPGPTRLAWRWLMAAALLVLVVVGQGLVRTPAARRVDVGREEPQIELVAPRTLPDVAPMPRPLVAPFAAVTREQRRCEEREAVASSGPRSRRRLVPRALAPRIAADEDVVAPTTTQVVDAPAAVEQGGAATPADASAADEELDLLPVGRARTNPGEPQPGQGRDLAVVAAGSVDVHK